MNCCLFKISISSKIQSNIVALTKNENKKRRKSLPVAFVVVVVVKKRQQPNLTLFLLASTIIAPIFIYIHPLNETFCFCF